MGTAGLVHAFADVCDDAGFAHDRSVHWTVRVSGKPSKGVFGGGNFPSLIIEGEVIWWALLREGHGCIIVSSKEDGLVGDRWQREGHILVRL